MLHSGPWRRLVLAPASAAAAAAAAASPAAAAAWDTTAPLLAHECSGRSLHADVQFGPGSLSAWSLSRAPAGELPLVLSGVTGALSDTRTSFATWLRH